MKRAIKLTLAGMFTALTTNAGVVAQQTVPAKPKPDVNSIVGDILKESERKQPGTDPRKESNPMTAAERQAIFMKLMPCWSGAGAAGDAVVVSIKVSMAPDARPTSAIIGDPARYNRDPAYKRVADAAHRAVMNPRCHPWPLAPEKYALWRTMTINFDGL